MKTSYVHLVIDTASPYLYIALLDADDGIIETVYEKGNNDHSVTLMKRLKGCFAKHDLQPSAIGKITVGVGPGSYTGVRVGVVVAKMLAWTLKVPLQTVSSLALVASAIKVRGDVLAWLDARRGNAFYGVFHVSDRGIERVESDQYCSMVKMRETHQYNEVFEGEPDIIKVLQSNLPKRIENIHELAPVYLRETEAEQALKEK